MLRKQIEKLVKGIVKTDVHLEHPSNAQFGDYSTNITMKAKIEPEKIIQKLKDNELFSKIEKAGPGFINFYLSNEIIYKELEDILNKDDKYGSLNIGKDKKVQVEFISANPTGPLTVANARGGPYGDVLANVLNKAGFKTEKAYYINDYGMQIISLGHSVLKDEQAKYQGEYIDQLAKKIKEKDVFKAGQVAAKYIVKDIQEVTDKLGIKYDEWIFESDLHKSGRVDNVLKLLEKNSLIYQKDNASWFKSSKFGDERDRVMIKRDKNKTYLAGDIALHDYKFGDKKFDKVINIWGADHHGDVPGLMAGVEAIGHKDKLEIVLYQFVTILDKGEKQKMSKRAGLYVEMDELLKKTSKDAVRFFFLQKSSDTHLNFDINLAQEQSSKNPVYYVQYAYARISGILEKAEDFNTDNSEIAKLKHSAELELIKELTRFPEIIEDTVRDYQVQRLPYYTLQLANSFHRFYENCRVIDKKDPELTKARISLIKATKIVLKSTLELMGISAPNKM